MNRRQTLDAAFRAVNDRIAYGPPENNFLRIARRWNIHILNRYGVHLALQPVDVAMMMADMKLARLEETPDHSDSWVDLCGYGACGAEISSGAETVYESKEFDDALVRLRRVAGEPSHGVNPLSEGIANQAFREQQE